ncbi:hypothetical protein PybrP1_000239 [[Pythium] brassicae (nom. inval.)]|nr:hypothetical protein PybrP1_000239 [[Pythium] brassicae (nom. inval.)]
MATPPNASAARQTLVLEAPPRYQPSQATPQGGASDAPGAFSSSAPGQSGSSPLEIAYSTISPKVDAQQPYPMHIKLNLIDQSVGMNGDSSSCESPFPMTPMTPGGSVDLSKKQRHNLREQRRILRISNQFDILRHKLEGAGYSSSKKDKFTVLQATLDYIAYLERNQQQQQHAPPQPPPSSSSRSQQQQQHHHHHHHQQQHIPQSAAPAPVPSHRLPSPAGPSRLSITAPSPSSHAQRQQLDAKAGTGAAAASSSSFIIDSMPSPVPSLSLPGGLQSFPIDLDSAIFGGAASAPGGGFHVDAIEGSSATYRDVFTNSSMPSLLAKLDGTIVEANALFLELCCKNIDELRLHSLYTMCTAMDTPKMYSLVAKILSCEMASAQSKMTWHFSSNSGDRKVFVSVSMIHDHLHRPANLHCSLLPLS